MFNAHDTPENDSDPVAVAWIRLLTAMVKRAKKDAGRGDQGAAAWLAWLRGEFEGSCTVANRGKWGPGRR